MLLMRKIFQSSLDGRMNIYPIELFIRRTSHKNMMNTKEGEDIGLFIILAPKVYNVNNAFLLVG